MLPNETPQRRTWRAKFGDAFRGAKQGVRGQSSFFVHLFMAAVVIAAASVMSCTLWEWCVLLLCISTVLTAEMFNSSIESLAKAINQNHDPNLGNALDIGSAAVLVASTGAALVGGIVFVYRLGVLLYWWPGK